jgi:hypothetical protein
MEFIRLHSLRSWFKLPENDKKQHQIEDCDKCQSIISNAILHTTSASSTLNTCSALLLEFWLVDGYLLRKISKKLVHTSYNSVVPSEADLVWRIALEIID